MKEFLSIPVLSKHQFRKILLDHIMADKGNWTVADTFDTFIDGGFPKLDFERLNECLPKIMVFLPTVAIEFGDSEFIWVVSGNQAILVKKASPPVKIPS